MTYPYLGERITFEKAPILVCDHDDVTVQDSDVETDGSTVYIIHAEVSCDRCDATNDCSDGNINAGDWSCDEYCEECECGTDNDCDCATCSDCGETNNDINWCDCGCCQVDPLVPNILAKMEKCTECADDIECVVCITPSHSSYESFLLKLCVSCHEEKKDEDARSPEWKNQVAKAKILEDMAKQIRMELKE